MPPPAPPEDGLQSKTWINLGVKVESYGSIIKQISTYLSQTKPSDVTDKYILNLDDFLNHLYSVADKNRWKATIKMVIKESLAKISSLAYIVKEERKKRSSDKFFNTVIELRKVMETLAKFF